MKKHLKVKKHNSLSKVVAYFILVIMLFLSCKNIISDLNISRETEKLTLNGKSQYLSGSTVSDECVYLSDIKYIEKESSVGWGSITLDSNLETQYNNGLITLYVKGVKTYFLKGISAHATSTLVYDISDYSDYDYFSTYIGIDESRGSLGTGVKFSIYTSKNGKDWELKTAKNPEVLKGDKDAILETIDIKDANYLKLYCDSNGNNASDHAVYANAKLYKAGYVEPETQKIDFIKTVAEYDEILKDKTLDDQLQNHELTLLQRTFVNNVGYDLLIAIANQNVQYRETIEWLMNNLENLRLYVLGGAPDGGSYYNSIKELSRLYHKYKDDFDIKDKTNNPWQTELTKGDVYRKMAISLSLTHATKVGYWAQIDHPSNRSDSVERYRIYKELYDGGKFIVARDIQKDDEGNVTSIKPRMKDGKPVQDQTPWFEALTVEEMRYVMNNITDDEELIWFNEYTQKRIDEHPGQEEKYLQPHTYIAYIWPDFERAEFHDRNLKEAWDKWFEGIFSVYHVTYSGDKEDTGHVYKAWMSMRNNIANPETGAVCGGISKLGCHIRAAHGTPASVVGQPGHAAIIYYRKDDQGRGYWTLDNDVSGWAQSGKSEKMGTRMPLGWGNDSYVDGYAATYMMLSQEAINDNANYEKSEEIIMTADIYKDNLSKQEEIYRSALDVQKINIDAWWGLINTYKANESKTEADYFELAKKLGEALKAFPLPMKNLLDQISPKLASVDYAFDFTVLETRLLNEGTTYGLTADGKEDKNAKLDVLQPSITRTVAKYLLGQTDTTLASFSFDGADAGKIVLSSKFDGNGVRFEYSLDGQKTWTEKSFEAEQPHKWALTEQEIAKINAGDDICINIVGANRTSENIYKIDIEEQEPLKDVYANDLENRLIGVDLNTYWRYANEGGFSDWVSYQVESPDLTGEKYVQIKQGATGTKLASSESEIYTFTQNNEPDNRKYVRVSEMEIYEKNTQSEDSSRPFYAENIIDANYNTLWHTNFKYSLQDENAVQPVIIIKLSRPKYISALEFMQKKYRPDDRDGIKSLTVSISEDGENWTEAGKVENLGKADYNTLQDITFNDSIYGQYIKLDMRSYDLFTSLSTVNIFEDITKIDTSIPTAGIYYSTTEKTKDYVIARLVDPSTEITITNNNGSDSYLFKENGEFEFQFEDKDGNKGSALAKVDWIDKDNPTADVDYKLDGNKKLLILLDSISEDVYLLDNNNHKTNFVEVKDQKVSKISYLDSSENVYKIVEVDQDGQTTKITYKNTTGKVSDVATYVTSYTNGEISKEEYLNKDGIGVDISDSDKETLKSLQQVKTNPLEYTFEESGEFEFKLLDTASNIAYKTIKADYLEDGNIIASDISYDINKTTNKDVVATINPYMISNEGKELNVKIVNNNSDNKYTFNNNHEFVFKYKDASDADDSDVKEHTAKVNWIDKDKPVADIVYSTQEATDGPVTATLVNESENIIITNNNMSKEFKFTENGKFEFEFEDEAGNTGTAVAEVNWINSKEEDKPEVGDIDKDGEITSSDLLLIKRHLVSGSNQEWKLKDEQFKAGDINKDNKITATDLLLMKRLVIENKKEQQ